MTYPSSEELAKEARKRGGLSASLQHAMGDSEVSSEEKEGRKENEPPEWFKFGAYLIIILIMLVVVILLGKAVVWAWNL